MNEPRTTRHQSDRQGLQGLIQCDLSTNLFAVFIAILAALQIIAVVSATTGFKQRVTPEKQQPQKPLGLVRSWHPVMPINKKVLIRNGRAIGLNLTPIAMGMAAGDNLFTDDRNITDQSRPLRSDRAPSAYIFMLHMDPATPFPAKLAAWSAIIPAEEEQAFPPKVERWIEAAQAVDIYVSVGQEKPAWRFAAYLSKANIPLRIQPLDSETAISFRRRTKFYGFEGVYK